MFRRIKTSVFIIRNLDISILAQHF